MSKRLAITAVLALSVGGMAIRVINIDNRPMHHDEANQAYKFQRLLEKGEYHYDADDHHGPTLYYLTLPVAWLTAGKDFGSLTETHLRLVPALFGTAIIFLTLTLLKAVGKGAVIWIALFAAISPAMIFHSRYYIQEMMLVFFTFGAIAAGWRYYQNKTLGSAIATGICLGLMYSTKETCIISWGCMGIAATGVLLIKRKMPKMNWKHLALLLGSALLVSVILFSSFFTNWTGVADSVMAYGGYFSKSTGTATSHTAGFLFYLERLFFHKTNLRIWSEAIIAIMAIVGAIVIVFRHRTIQGQSGFLLFILLYTVTMVLIYSTISYKTPWCMLSFLHGLIILAGVGAAWSIGVMRNLPLKGVVTVLLAIGAVHLAYNACWVNFRGYQADQRNPWVYEHTTTTFLRLVKRIEDISCVSEEGQGMLIAVYATPDKTWPLPWYLRKYERTRKGFWTPQHNPDFMSKNPAIIITSAETNEILQPMVEGKYIAEIYGLRPGVRINAYIRQDLWDKFMESRT